MGTKKRVIEEFSPQADKGLKQEGTPDLEESNIHKDDTFKAKFNMDTGVAYVELTDGTSVEMRCPKTRQFLLLEGFLKQAPKDYQTETFIFLKLASLCITKFGDETNIGFDDLVDSIELEDMERLAAALAFFQDKLNHLQKRTVH